MSFAEAPLGNGLEPQRASALEALLATGGQQAEASRLKRWKAHAKGVTARFVQNCTLSGGGRLEASMDRPGGRPFGLRGGGKCCQPFDRTWRLVPRWAAFRDVVGRLVRAAHRDVVTLRGHTFLGSGQNGRDVLVRSQGLLDQLHGLGARPVLPKRQQCLGVEPSGAAFVLIGGEQFLERRFISLPEQVGCEQVTDALVVVRVQPEHVAVVSHGAFDIAQLHEGSSKTGPRTHVGPRLEEAPEMARIVLAAFRTKRHLARLHALGIIVPRFLDGPGSLFGQQHVGIGTERRDTECLACQCDPRSGGGLLPGVVHHVLRLGRCGITTASGDRRQKAFHAAPVWQRWRRRSFRRPRGGDLRARLLRDWHFLVLHSVSAHRRGYETVVRYWATIRETVGWLTL